MPIQHSTQPPNHRQARHHPSIRPWVLLHPAHVGLDCMDEVGPDIGDSDGDLLLKSNRSAVVYDLQYAQEPSGERVKGTALHVPDLPTPYGALRVHHSADILLVAN